ncbi:MAG: hypothetical protein HY059_04825 [Proteobacteria bacterium]|nr:hypothetical protein [Pseudomonadota bacterium]
MGAFAAAAPFAMMAAQTAMSMAQNASARSAASDQAEAQARAVQAQADRQRELLDRQYASETRRRTNLLDRATARARVSFGARGLSPTDGSAGALLDGIDAGFGVEEAERDQDYQMRRSSLDSGLAQSLQGIDFARSRNLLDRDSDIQRRIFGLLNWGGRGGRRGGGGDSPVGDFPADSGSYDNYA